MFPTYDRGERLADRWIHVIGLTAAFLAIPVLIAAALQHGGASLVAGIVVYSAGLLAMLGCSALYNLASPSPRKEVYRRLDHAAIYAMIAGTYTPFTLSEIGGAWGIGLFAFVWLAAAAGIAMKLLYPRRFEGLSIALYLVLGWSVLAGLDHLLSAVPLPVVILLGVGGLLYSGGVFFHLWKPLRYHNAVWHAFVLMGAACHYAAVLWITAVGPAPYD